MISKVEESILLKKKRKGPRTTSKTFEMTRAQIKECIEAFNSFDEGETHILCYAIEYKKSNIFIKFNRWIWINHGKGMENCYAINGL